MRYKVLAIEVPICEESSGPALYSADYIYSLLKSDLADLAQETFIVLTLDQKNHVIDRHVIAIGTLTECLVHPRDVFRHAILDNAASIAVAHNHPSGDPAPSSGDKQITDRIAECAKMLGFRLLDHVIIGNGRYYSFAGAGALCGAEV